MDFQFDLNEYISLQTEEINKAGPSYTSQSTHTPTTPKFPGTYEKHTINTERWFNYQNTVRASLGKTPISLLDKSTKKLDFNSRISALNAKFQGLTMSDTPVPKEDIPTLTLSDEDGEDTLISESNIEDMLSCASTLQYPEELANALESMPNTTTDNNKNIQILAHTTVTPNIEEIEKIDIVEEFQYRAEKIANEKEKEEADKRNKTSESSASSDDQSLSSVLLPRGKKNRKSNTSQSNASAIAQEVFQLLTDSQFFRKLQLDATSTSEIIVTMMTKILDLTLEVREMRNTMIEMEKGHIKERTLLTKSVLGLHNEFMRMSSEISAQRNATMAGVTAMPQTSTYQGTPLSSPKPHMKEFDQATMEAFCYTRFGCNSVNVPLLKSTFRFRDSFDKILGHLYKTEESDKLNAWIVLIAYMIFTKEGQKDELYPLFKMHYAYLGQHLLTLNKNLPLWIEWLWDHVKGGDQPKTVRGKTTHNTEKLTAEEG